MALTIIRQCLHDVILRFLTDERTDGQAYRQTPVHSIYRISKASSGIFLNDRIY